MLVPFRLTVCGLEEIDGHCRAGVSHVLSILDPGWPAPEFGRYGEHARLELRFNDVIEADAPGAPPAPEHVARVLQFGAGLREGDHLLVHCHAGVSRSTAAMTLILAQARPDSAAEEVMAEVVRIRKQAWPNLRMIELGDATLGRNGALVAAAHARYAAVLARKPYKAETFTEAGRGREVRGATGA
jgi:predicted protein tyrosine phosphatase